MAKQLLREFFQLCPDGVCQDILTEDEKRLVREDNALFLSGVIQAADLQNGNGRIYPRVVLQREITSYKTIIKENRAVGELDHPDDSVVNLRNVSHKVTDCWWDGNNVMGKIQVLGTPAGQTLRALVEGGVGVGISSRGLGSVTESKGSTMVEDDFQLICFDIVQEPSTSGAFLFQEQNKNNSNLLHESKNQKINSLMDDILK
jgi:hypothetical protein